MKELDLIYNILTVLLYGIPISLSYVIYLKSKNLLYLFTAILFLFYIFDDTIVYLTEFSENFSVFYDTMFMTTPTIKTLLFIVPYSCMIAIDYFCLKMTSKQLMKCVWGLIILIVCLMFAPMLPGTSMKVWIYYTLCSIFMISLSIYSLYILKNSNENFSEYITKYYKAILIINAILFAVVIFEDSYVIFNVDNYTTSSIDIYNRSISQDILRVFQSVIAIIMLYGHIETKVSQGVRIITGVENETFVTANPDSPENKVDASDRDGKSGSNEIYSKFYLFCRKYQLTTREQDIFRLLLENKSNTEISEELFISLGTAKTHIHNIFLKLDIKKRNQLNERYESFDENEYENEL